VAGGQVGGPRLPPRWPGGVAADSVPGERDVEQIIAGVGQQRVGQPGLRSRGKQAEQRRQGNVLGRAGADDSGSAASRAGGGGDDHRVGRAGRASVWGCYRVHAAPASRGPVVPQRGWGVEEQCPAAAGRGHRRAPGMWLARPGSIAGAGGRGGRRLGRFGRSAGGCLPRGGGEVLSGKSAGW
jgi:hypothetical protein